MFKKSYNRAVLRFRLDTVTPLLIRAGDAGLDPTAAELSCVRTRHARFGRTVYIPGSSLKGVLRSAAEATVRGRRFNGIEGACDPLDHDQSCGGKIRQQRKSNQRREDALPTHAVHVVQCLACRLFGSLVLKGRASIRDSLPWREDQQDADQNNREQANRVEIRNGVAIDRVTGSVRSGVLYDLELVPAGVSFWGDIALENYQAWQLGLLGQAFAEVNEGFAQLGSSKSRGLGVARIEVESIVHEQARRGKPVGVGKIASAEERDLYKLFQDIELPSQADPEERGLSVRFRVDGPELAQAWMDAGLKALGELR